MKTSGNIVVAILSVVVMSTSALASVKCENIQTESGIVVSVTSTSTSEEGEFQLDSSQVQNARKVYNACLEVINGQACREGNYKIRMSIVHEPKARDYNPYIDASHQNTKTLEAYTSLADCEKDIVEAAKKEMGAKANTRVRGRKYPKTGIPFNLNKM